MLSIQNFKEDISYVIIKKVCDLIIVLDGLNGVSMVQTLFNVSLLCSRFNNWKKTNCVLIIQHDNILYHVIIQYCIMIWYNIVSYNIISLQNHVLTSFCLWWKFFFFRQNNSSFGKTANRSDLLHKMLEYELIGKPFDIF